METLIVLALLVAIVGGAIGYIYKKRKAGVKCIGCPCAKNGGCCSCKR
ncbi:MAG: FeoB-associated Cys-rich membrane protein [Firmicutes bacterium]|nr:FeoB-associated Cys-rich membrane protein [Bacillota bacterium]